MEAADKITVEDEKVNQDIIHPENYKGRSHDTEGLRVKLGKE